MSREGRKRRRGMKWTPYDAPPVSIRDVTDEHLAKIHHMIETREVLPGGHITQAYTMNLVTHATVKAQWGNRVVREIGRRWRRRQRVAGG